MPGQNIKPRAVCARRGLLLALVLLATAAAGCMDQAASEGCVSDAECAAGLDCQRGVCVMPPDVPPPNSPTRTSREPLGLRYLQDGVCLEISPDALAFGVVPSGQLSERLVLVSNCSHNAHAVIEQVYIDGVGLQLLGRPYTSTPLAPGAGYLFRAQFTGGYPGKIRGKVSVRVRQQGARPALIELPWSAEVPDAQGCLSADVLTRDGARILARDHDRVTPGAQLTFEVDESDQRPAARFEWALIERPAGSTARLTPNTSAATPRMLVDAPGVYRVQVQRYDDDGAPICEPSVYSVIACSCEDDTVIQLTWNTPVDADQGDALGADLDLLYKPAAQPWTAASVVSPAQPLQQWSTFEEARMTRADADGSGPETITHTGGVPGQRHDVAVYYRDDAGLGASFATVRVYHQGQLVYERRDQRLVPGDLLHLATIDQTDGSVTPQDTLGTLE